MLEKTTIIAIGESTKFAEVKDIKNQDKIQFLKKYKELNRGIKRQLDKKEMWLSRATKVTQTITDMPRSGDGENPRELAACEMMDCEMEINQLIDQLCNLRQQVRQYMLETGEKDNDLLVVLRIEK